MEGLNAGLYAAPCAAHERDLVVRCLKIYFNVEKKHDVFLFCSCSAGLLMTEILDLYINMEN